MAKLISGLLLLLTVCSADAQKKQTALKQSYSAYLFVYFTGNNKSEEAIRFAISKDGFNYRALNGNQPVVNSTSISETGGVRDPHILRDADGKTFYMVATDMVSAKGWNSNRGMVLMRSADLVHWTSSAINFQKRYKGQDSLLRVWAPQTIYDAKAQKYMVYFSLKYGKQPDKIYYAYANSDFTDLEGELKQLFYNPDNAACIDGDIETKDGKFYLFFKTEDRQPGIKIAVSDDLTNGYTMQSTNYVQQTTSPVEGAGTFRLNNSKDYVLMYDMYTSGRYQFTRTADMQHFKVVDDEVSMNFHPRHGTVMPITDAEAKRLMTEWFSPEDAIMTVKAVGVKNNNINLDTAGHKIYLPIVPGTNLKTIHPAFMQLPAVSIKPIRPVDFSKGSVTYAVSIAGKKPINFKLAIIQNHNPVLAGFYADPEVLYAEKTGRFYIYPTSDGFQGWGGTYFKAFSSTDLVHWKDNGVILDLNKDVSWANRNAWAPCIIEKKINGAYKYFYYFCAAQKIGVAVADDPLGPFVDSGKPLIDKLPEGVKGGQQIDPDVFTDPQTGKSYLYWGNGYMAGAELNEDMISIKPGTTRTLTPDRTFREGTYVFFRNGKYYFTWSEDDTRSPNYKVRYGVADGPLGKIIVPPANLVIEKNVAEKIYGTGHNSVLQLPGQDKWYLVYHRFNYPNGITMGDAAGWNREVCIDEMEFNVDGTIKQVIPTHKGISPIVMPESK